MSETHKRFVLVARPVGMPKDSDFRIEESAVPVPAEGQFVVRVQLLSVDPYMRARMSDAPSYSPPVQLGETMIGGGAGQVIASKNSRFAVGDSVVGFPGWQTHVATDGRGWQKVDPGVAPISTFLGVLGLTGLTAYFGLLDICHPKPGETVVVSGAAGAVGSIVGQLAKIQGCRVVGIAGADDKVKWLTEELGFDAAFNYKSVTNYKKALSDVCPNGVDVYFDNVGGAITDAAILLLNLKGRVSICGQISQYNNEKLEMGPRLLGQLIVKRAKIEGFLVTDYAARFPEAIAAMAPWLKEGKLRHREQFVDGFENTLNAFRQLMEGGNTGKMLVRL